jgi:hypothetical protein
MSQPDRGWHFRASPRELARRPPAPSWRGPRRHAIGLRPRGGHTRGWNGHFTQSCRAFHISRPPGTGLVTSRMPGVTWPTHTPGFASMRRMCRAELKPASWRRVRSESPMLQPREAGGGEGSVDPWTAIPTRLPRRFRGWCRASRGPHGGAHSRSGVAPRSNPPGSRHTARTSASSGSPSLHDR